MSTRGIPEHCRLAAPVQCVECQERRVSFPLPRVFPARQLVATARRPRSRRSRQGTGRHDQTRCRDNPPAPAAEQAPPTPAWPTVAPLSRVLTPRAAPATAPADCAEQWPAKRTRARARGPPSWRNTAPSLVPGSPPAQLPSTAHMGWPALQGGSWPASRGAQTPRPGGGLAPTPPPPALGRHSFEGVPAAARHPPPFGGGTRHDSHPRATSSRRAVSTGRGGKRGRRPSPRRPAPALAGRRDVDRVVTATRRGEGATERAGQCGRPWAPSTPDRSYLRRVPPSPRAPRDSRACGPALPPVAAVAPASNAQWLLSPRASPRHSLPPPPSPPPRPSRSSPTYPRVVGKHGSAPDHRPPPNVPARIRSGGKKRLVRIDARHPVVAVSHHPHPPPGGPPHQYL